MDDVSQLTEFGKIFLFLTIGIILVLVTFFLNRLLSPHRPTPEKLTTYECGEEPEGNSWLQFNPRFYVIALVFLLFDVEMAFIFPWATIFGQETLLSADPRWGWFTLSEMFIFVGILILGLVYVWRKGDLEWVRPQPQTPKTDTRIPLDVYQRINAEHYTVKPFIAEPSVMVQEGKTETESGSKPRPMFKPTFKKANG